MIKLYNLYKKRERKWENKIKIKIAAYKSQKMYLKNKNVYGNINTT